MEVELVQQILYVMTQFLWFLKEISNVTKIYTEILPIFFIKKLFMVVPIDGDVVTLAPLRLMIFSSISALTETEAVCRGGPVDSFLSSFLLSESYK